MTWWLAVPVALASGLLLCWLALLVVLLAMHPGKDALRAAVRLLPDVLRLVARLARDRSLPAGARLRLWLLLGYLALPIDLVPDFLPVIGYADDALLVAVVLRSVIRRAGPEPVRRHWPGSAEGLRVLVQVTGLPLP